PEPRPRPTPAPRPPLTPHPPRGPRDLHKRTTPATTIATTMTMANVFMAQPSVRLGLSPQRGRRTTRNVLSCGSLMDWGRRVGAGAITPSASDELAWVDGFPGHQHLVVEMRRRAVAGVAGEPDALIELDALSGD